MPTNLPQEWVLRHIYGMPSIQHYAQAFPMLPLYILHSYATNRDLYYLNQDYLMDACRANLPLKDVMGVLSIPYILRKVQTLDVYGGSEQNTVLDTWHMYYTVASNRHLPDTEFSRLYFGLPIERRRAWLAKLYVFLSKSDYRHAEAYVLYFARNADGYRADELNWAIARMAREQLPTTLSMATFMDMRRGEIAELERREKLRIEQEEMRTRENEKLRKFVYENTSLYGSVLSAVLTKPLHINDYRFNLLSTESEFEHLGMILGNCLGGYKYTLQGGELAAYAAVYKDGQVYGAVEFRTLFTSVGQSELHHRRKFTGTERDILEEARKRYRELLMQLANPPAPPVSNTVCERSEGPRTAVQVGQATTLRQNRVSAYGLPEPVPHGGLGYGGDRRSAVIGNPSEADPTVDTMFVRHFTPRRVDWNEYANGIIDRRQRLFNDQQT